jgi:nucleoside-diphosphate-sugar epimerase
MKVLVTGATGFIGSHLIDYLLRDGNEVIATSTNKSSAMLQPWFFKVNFKEYQIGQLSLTNINLFNYFDKPDILIHLAWQGLPNYNEQYHIDENLFSQYYFLKNLIEGGVKNICISGTCLEYGLVNGCMNEEQLSNPANNYALAKDSLRKFISLLSDKYNFSFKWVRLFYMYGSGQSKNSLIPQLEEAIQSKNTNFRMSRGEQIRDFLSIDKVAEYICKISYQREIDGIINCCSGRPISVRNFIEQYIKENNYNINLDLGYYQYPSYEPFAFWGDDKKLHKILSI